MRHIIFPTLVLSLLFTAKTFGQDELSPFVNLEQQLERQPAEIQGLQTQLDEQNAAIQGLSKRHHHEIDTESISIATDAMLSESVVCDEDSSQFMDALADAVKRTVSGRPPEEYPV